MKHKNQRVKIIMKCWKLDPSKTSAYCYDDSITVYAHQECKAIRLMAEELEPYAYLCPLGEPQNEVSVIRYEQGDIIEYDGREMIRWELAEKASVPVQQQ